MIEKEVKTINPNIEIIYAENKIENVILNNSATPPYKSFLFQGHVLDDLYELIQIRLEKLYNDPRIHRCKMRMRLITLTFLKNKML